MQSLQYNILETLSIMLFNYMWNKKKEMNLQQYKNGHFWVVSLWIVSFSLVTFKFSIMNIFYS